MGRIGRIYANSLSTLSKLRNKLIHRNLNPIDSIDSLLDQKQELEQIMRETTLSFNALINKNTHSEEQQDFLLSYPDIHSNYLHDLTNINDEISKYLQ